MNRFLYSILVSVLSLYIQAYENVPSFVLLVTSYNNEKYVERNLRSLLYQRSSTPYKIIYVNDCSTDNTGKLVDEFVARHSLSPDFIEVLHNEKRVGAALENIYNVVHSRIADDEIVVSIDGDDMLAHKGVLQRLEKAYANPEIWMTFGRFVVIPSGEFWMQCSSYPPEVIYSRTFRQSPNVPSHLKTFKAGLFKKIKKEDLCGPDGSFFTKAGDMAFMFPMLEMCAPSSDVACNHSAFIEDTVLYMYNADTGLNDHYIGREEQIKLDLFIRSKKTYKPLNSL
ncbi:glycosyltransferase family 2 protein [Candidatus Dependentiae bacterium]|nr:glycosyltransferase family 2 protein [Candidatus Dependentiae bacterium]